MPAEDSRYISSPVAMSIILKQESLGVSNTEPSGHGSSLCQYACFASNNLLPVKPCVSAPLSPIGVVCLVSRSYMNDWLFSLLCAGAVKAIFLSERNAP